MTELAVVRSPSHSRYAYPLSVWGSSDISRVAAARGRAGNHTSDGADPECLCSADRTVILSKGIFQRIFWPFRPPPCPRVFGE